MKSFLTGSRRYGKPELLSDIDLVIRADLMTYLELQDQADSIAEAPPGSKEYEDGVMSLRFGTLNLIVCTDDETYAQWMLGTEMLEQEAKEGSAGPLTTERAKAFFDTIRGLKVGKL